MNIRLSNSSIISLSGLSKVLQSMQKYKLTMGMTNLSWQDLSFNKLTQLGPDGGLTALKGLRYGH